MPSKPTTLTKSGAGLWRDVDRSGNLPSIDELRGLLREHRFLVLRNAFDSAADAVDFMGAFGPINCTGFRPDGAVLVEDLETDEVFRSSFALPLHKDGILTGLDVDLVGIYCAELRDVVGGRTYVSDANRALSSVPGELVERLRSQGLEGLAVDATGHYRREYNEAWHRFPAFRSRRAEPPTLNIGLPHRPGELESWRVRVPDMGEEESAVVLETISQALLDADHVYFHDWREGDLLLMDNYTVLHGREAFKARSRKLANIQVLLD